MEVVRSESMLASLPGLTHATHASHIEVDLRIGKTYVHGTHFIVDLKRINCLWFVQEIWLKKMFVPFGIFNM